MTKDNRSTLNPAVGLYANQIGFSDVSPFEIVRVISLKTIEIREMEATLDPTWKPQIDVGGFVGHTVNNADQRWICKSDPEAPVMRARLHKDGCFHSEYGKHLISEKPQRFYDYNF